MASVVSSVSDTKWKSMFFGTISGLTLAGVCALAIVKQRAPKKRNDVIAFFHPIAKDGGGGERVLWCAIRAVMKANANAQVVLFTDLPEYEQGQDIAQVLSERALNKFGVELPGALEVVPVNNTSVVDPKNWPRFTLLCQSFASIALGHEALMKLVPAVYVDTAGMPFILPLARLLGCQTVSYVHYPIISMNMLQRVMDRKEMYNNQSGVSGSSFHSALKVVYYRLFALLYGAVGGCAQVAMVNSSWTRNHIQQLWWGWKVSEKNPGPFRVYPPCNVEDLTSFPLYRYTRKPILISIGQFRPEKAHETQLEAYALSLKQAKNSEIKAIQNSRLILIGGCRNEDDYNRVEMLKKKAEELGISKQVEFCVNIEYEKLKGYLKEAVAGLHTMIDEHFGIGIVEYMAAGVIAIANNSGGPAADIVLPATDNAGNSQATGYLASTVEEYANAIVNVLSISDKEREKMATIARSTVNKFSENSFDGSFINAISKILQKIE